MLAGDFFNITTIQQDNGKINAVLQINAAHKIFEGHFPGQPVVPGVCMRQMVKEILDTSLNKTTRLVKADNIKFLSVLDPAQNNIVTIEINCTVCEDGSIKAGASITNGAVTYFKMNGLFLFATAP